MTQFSSLKFGKQMLSPCIRIQIHWIIDLNPCSRYGLPQKMLPTLNLYIFTVITFITSKTETHPLALLLSPHSTLNSLKVNSIDSTIPLRLTNCLVDMETDCPENHTNNLHLSSPWCCTYTHCIWLLHNLITAVTNVRWHFTTLHVSLTINHQGGTYRKTHLFYLLWNTWSRSWWEYFKASCKEQKKEKIQFRTGFFPNIFLKQLLSRASVLGSSNQY